MPRVRRPKKSTRVDSLAVVPEVLSATEMEKHDEAASKLALYKEWKRARQKRAQLARKDINEFCAFVGRDAETGERITQEPIHVEFQGLAGTNKRLILMAHPESGKSTQIGILRVLWLLGNNPNLRVAIISKTGPNAAKSSRAIKSYIEKSPELAEVFPELVPGDKWSDDFFTVRRGVHSRDPSVQALGLSGTIIGSRVDLMIFDDALDLENTSTANERKKTLRRIRAGFLDRMSKDGSALFLTNAWHPEDAAHIFKKEGWPCLKVPVLDDDGAPTWEAKWPLWRINEAREDMGPLEFARAHLCKARDEGESPFDEDAITAAVELAHELGIDLVYTLQGFDLPPGAHVFHGIDLAVSKTKTSHLTAIVTVLLWPDQSRQILWVEAGRWSSREIRDRVLDTDKRYAGTFIVENNAAQRWIIDIIQNQDDLAFEDRRLPELVPFTTGKNKAHAVFGVEGLAVEIAAGKWAFPDSGAAKAVKEVEELKGEMLYYVRGAHTGDRLMALWFAREGARRGIKASTPEEEEKPDINPWGNHEQEIPGGGVKIYDASDDEIETRTPFG